MADFLFQAWLGVQRSYEAALRWLASRQYDPRQWDALTWLLVAAALLVIVALLVSGNRRRRRAAGPQFLLTNGQVKLVSELPRAADGDGGRRQPSLLQAPANADYQLRVTVNNLNSYPVQLLEIALRTSGGKLPVVADASAVVPPNGAVDVVADISDLPGEHGTLELYLYNTRVAPRSLRLIVPLDWEPWNQRYRVRATAQHLEGTRVVASEVRQRQERAAVRRDRVKEWVGSTTKGVSERAVALRREVSARRERAVRERRERREAERQEAERREGPFAVPLAPSGSRSNDIDRGPAARDDGREPLRRVWRKDDGDRLAADAGGDDSISAPVAGPGSDEGLRPPAGESRQPTEGSRPPGEESRAPEDLELTDRKPEPPRRLEFPDEF